MYTSKQIQDIFSSRSTHFGIDKQQISDICYLLNEGFLKIKSKVFASKEEYLQVIDDINQQKIAAFDIDGGSIEHMALKWCSTRLFQHLKPLFEVKFDGYIPDVLFVTGQKYHVIECGDTNTDKIFHYFKNKKLLSVSIIPYPHESTKKLIAYIFTPGNDLLEFLNFWEEEKRNKIKEKLKRK